MSFWWEVKRRHIPEAAIAYVVLVWGLAKIVSRIFGARDLPAWAAVLVAVLVAAGLPLVLYFWWIVNGKATDGTGTGTAAAGRVAGAPPDTIAVLPFEDLSPDSDQKYFVDGLSEELLNRISRVPGLRVIARTSSFSFRDGPRRIQEIADELGATHILEGSVRKSGSSLRINVQLVRTSDGFNIWSESYSRKIRDLLAVQADIAAAVSGSLCDTLGVDYSMITPGSTENVEAYELYLFAQGLILEGDEASLKRALGPLDAAIAMDPGFVFAWERKAVVHNFLAFYEPVDQVAVELDAGMEAARRAIELDPGLAAGYAALGNNRSSRGDWIGAENEYLKAFALAKGPVSTTVAAIPIHYLSVGRIKKAHEFIREMREADPLNKPNRAFYMLSFVLLGDRQRSEAEYERGNMLFGGDWLWGNVFIMLIRLGAGRDITADMLPEMKNNTISGVVRKYIQSPEEGLGELRRLYVQERSLSTGNLVDIAFWAAHFGDAEFAMTIMEKVFECRTESVFYFWLPAMAEVRKLPRFREFAREIGLVDYWNEFGWPDILPAWHCEGRP